MRPLGPVWLVDLTMDAGDARPDRGGVKGGLIGCFATLVVVGCGARTGLLLPDAGPADAAADTATAEIGGAHPDVATIDTLVFDSGTIPDTPDFEVADIGLPDALPPPTVTFDVPFEEPPTPGKRSIATTGDGTIRQVDVAIVIDTTGSMNGSIDNLRKNLKSSMLPGIAAAIPSVGLAIVEQRDYPIEPWGSVGDLPVKVQQTVTPSVALAQSALDKLVAAGGSDTAEAHIPAMWHTLTGGELRWDGGLVPKHTSAPGTVGGVDFRGGSLRVVVLVTDAAWHDCDYGPRVVSPPCFATLSKAFVASNAQFVDLTHGAAPGPFEAQANLLSDETRSNLPPSAFGGACGGGCCTGIGGAARPAEAAGGRCRLNFLHNSGNGVSDSIVRAIQAISVGSAFDVIAQVFDDPSDSVDATKFVRIVRAMQEGDAAAGCAARPAIDTDGDGIKDRFLAVETGTRVCFEVIPAVNTTVKPTSEDQYFLAGLQILGMPGLVWLETQTLRFRVPKLGASDAATD